jgi:Tfp pilus assembly protein PilF
MSLISDALKEAQRERTQRSGRPSPAVIGDNFFPIPADRARAQSSRAALIFSVAGAVLVLGAFGLWRVRAQSRPRVPAPARPPAAVSHVGRGVPAVPQPTTAPPSAPTAPIKIVNATPAPRPNEKGVSPHASNSASASASAAVPRVTSASPANVKPAPAAVDSAPKAAAVATPPAGAPPAQASSVRIVLDGSAARPGDSLFARAYAEQVRGNYDLASDLYEKALQKPPVSAELYNNYGALLDFRGKHDAAVAMYNLGLAKNDRDPKLWTNLGIAYDALGQHANALSAYFAAAKLDPSNVSVKIRLASEYLAIGDTANARRGFSDAVAINPKDARAHYALGAYLVGQRDYRAGIKEIQAYVDLAPASEPPDQIEKVKAYFTSLRKLYP